MKQFDGNLTSPTEGVDATPVAPNDPASAPTVPVPVTDSTSTRCAHGVGRDGGGASAAVLPLHGRRVGATARSQCSAYGIAGELRVFATLLA